MSEPLFVLGKHRRAPLPGLRATGGKATFKEVISKDRDLSAAKQIQNVPCTTGPLMLSGKIPQKMTKNSDSGLNLKPISSTMEELSMLQHKLTEQALDLQHKDQTIAALEEELKQLQIQRESGNEQRRVQDLEKSYAELQVKVLEIERFLSDYGVIWLSEGKRNNISVQQEERCTDWEAQMNEEEVRRAEQDVQHDCSMWLPGACIRENFHMDFDLVLQNIQELNLLAGEGTSQVEVTQCGARLVHCSSVPLTLYSNGIIMSEGPFRSYQELCTQQFIQDLMDGYFPSELQRHFPDGVFFQVFDKRNEVFKERPLWAGFPGKGRRVGESAEIQSQNHIPEDSDGAGLAWHMSRELFLNKLPKIMIKAGNVIQVRDAVKATLKNGSTPSQHTFVTLLNTAVLKGEDQRYIQSAAAEHTLSIPESGRTPSAGAITTLHVRAEDGETTFVIQMFFHETIGHLRQYLDEHRGPEIAPYDIISAFPQYCYDNNSHTLVDCGLTHNSMLLLRARKHNDQCTLIQPVTVE